MTQSWYCFVGLDSPLTHDRVEKVPIAALVDSLCMRLVQAWNQSRTIGINFRTVYTKNQVDFNEFDLLVIYIASVNPSGTIIINIPLNYNNIDCRIFSGS
jgi:hypothetical protein